MVVADVYGVFSWTFCDFGDIFEVVDPDGEEPKQVFISNVTKVFPAKTVAVCFCIILVRICLCVFMCVCFNMFTLAHVYKLHQSICFELWYNICIIEICIVTYEPTLIDEFND